MSKKSVELKKSYGFLLPGDMRVFEAEDDGDLEKLASVTVPKQLAVKVGCPVILTVN